MLFTFSAGSVGTGPDRYVACVPFVVAPGATLNTPVDPVSHSVGDSILKLTLEKLQLLYSLTLGPFPTEREALSGLDTVEAALLWASLALGVGVQYARERKPATLFDAPRPVVDSGPMRFIRDVRGWDATDGSYEAEHAIARPDHKRLIRWEMGRPTLTVGIGSDNLLRCLEQALSFPNLSAVIADDKLRLAIELCAGHRFELSENAQFIGLVTALEALLPGVDVSPAAKIAIDEAAELTRATRDQQPRQSEQWTELNRLLSRVSQLKHEAIGTSMRRFAETVILRNPELGDAATAASGLRKAYDTRSGLLHNGIFDPAAIGTHLKFLRDFVPRLLRVLFEEASGARP